MWKTPWALLFGTLAFGSGFIDGPMLRPPQLMPEEMLEFPPPNLYMSPTQVDVPPAWLDFCPPLLFSGLEPPEPWDTFAPLIYEEPAPAQFLWEPEPPPENFEVEESSFDSGPGPSLIEAIAVSEPPGWMFIAGGFALLAGGTVPRRRLRFER